MVSPFPVWKPVWCPCRSPGQADRSLIPGPAQLLPSSGPSLLQPPANQHLYAFLVRIISQSDLLTFTISIIISTQIFYISLLQSLANKNSYTFLAPIICRSTTISKPPLPLLSASQNLFNFLLSIISQSESLKLFCSNYQPISFQAPIINQSEPIHIPCLEWTNMAPKRAVFRTYCLKKSPKTPFFSQKYLIKYTCKMIFEDYMTFTIFCYLRRRSVCLFKISEVKYAPSCPD